MRLTLPKARSAPDGFAEVRLQRLTRARSIMADCMRVLVHAADEPAMLREICGIVVERGGHRSAWIGFAEHDEQKTVSPVASAGIALGEAQNLRLTWGDRPKGRGAVGTALRTRRPRAIDDYFAQAEYAAWREFAAAHGFRSGVALPLLVDESCSGVLMINSPEVCGFDAEEVALLEELAGDIAFGIRSLRARHHQVQAGRALRESENLFREFAANTPGLYWVREADSERILYVSPAWEKITGWPQPPNRKAFFAMIHPEDVDRALADARAAPQGGVDHEYRIIRPDRSVRWLHVQTYPVRDDRGEVYRIAGVGEDVTEHKQAESALAAKTEALRDTLENMAQGITVIDRDLRLVAWNRRLLELLEFPETLGREGAAFEDFIRHNALRGDYGPGDPKEQVRTRVELAKRFEAHCVERVRPNGTVLEIRGVPLPGGGFVTTYTDITDRRRAEAALRESEQQLRQLAANIPEAYWVGDVASGRILYLSPAFTRITGWRLEPGCADIQQMHDIVFADDCKRVLTAAGQARLGGFDEQYRIVRPDGAMRWVHTRTFPIRNPQGEVYRLAGVTEDISEKRAADERLEQMALYDTLTSLPNRTLFYRNVQQTLDRAKAGDGVVALMFLDLDRFKNVNDTLGHTVGDELLQQVATRLVRAIRVRDTLGRLGGDEFAVLLPNLTRAEDAGVVAAKILRTLAEPVMLDGHEMFVTASIGIAVAPTDGDDPDVLIRAADTAMYRAKKSGRNTSRFYKAKMNEHALERLQLETQLRRAVERNEFRLHYQPKMRLGDMCLSGAEALLRWNRPDHGLVSPADFVPLLEETGMIVPVGAWVIREACRQIGAWRDAGLAPVRVAINLSPRQFLQRDLAALIRRAAQDAGIEPQRLEFEITESTLMSNAEETIEILTELKAAGIRLSVDDFGTGYSSLSYLKRFPIDALKIDRSFVRDATTNADDAAIVRAIIGMAHDLGLKVIAEGVETEEQVGLLRECRCDEIQGYLFSKPVDAEALAGLLRGGTGQAWGASAQTLPVQTVAGPVLRAAAVTAAN